MGKKKEFLSQEKRDEYNKKIEDIKSRMQQVKRDDDHSTYDEALKEWLLPAHQSNAKGPAYLFLCQQLKSFLEDSSRFFENQAALRMAKENFENYCDMKERL